jgi:hypothetical protein
MHNLEDVIEKYYRELIEFSKQNPQENHTAPVMAQAEQEEQKAVPVMAQVTDEMPQDMEQPVQEKSAVEQTASKRVVEEQDIYETYEDFLTRNANKSVLKVQVFAAEQSFPISNAKVSVTVMLKMGEKELYNGYTDIDGVVDNISLPAPDNSYSLDENNTIMPYAVYNLTVTHPKYASAEFKRVPVFDSVISIQPVQLVPLTKSGTEPKATVIDGQPMTLAGGEG